MNSTHCNNVIAHALSVSFARIFALSLTRFFTNSGGFDVVAFEKALFHGEGCLEDNVRRKYGQDGVLLLRKLTSAEPLSEEEKEQATKALGRYYVAAVSMYHEEHLVSA